MTDAQATVPKIQVRVSYKPTIDYNILDVDALLRLRLSVPKDRSLYVTRSAELEPAQIADVLKAIPCASYVCYNELMLIYPDPIEL
jgi:hypothetical protein